jgi:hypothetical protein
MMELTTLGYADVPTPVSSSTLTLRPGDTLCFGDAAGGIWMVEAVDPPRLVPLTAARGMPLRRPQPRLEFHVSCNEEHTTLRIAGLGAGALDLGERTHHYCLLTLARRRLEDVRRGLTADTQGWIETGALGKMLGIDPPHLNIQLHRARTQLASALPAGLDMPAVVERRRGELRLAALAFQVMRGAQFEGEWMPDAGARPDR